MLEVNAEVMNVRCCASAGGGSVQSLLNFIDGSQTVVLNSPPLNFPHTTATNLFLTGSNYATVFQDAEKTNGRNSFRCNETTVLFVVGIWVKKAVLCRCFWSWSSPSWFVNVEHSQPALLIPFPNHADVSVKGQAVHPSIMLSDGGPDTSQTAGSTACRNGCSSI